MIARRRYEACLKACLTHSVVAVAAVLAIGGLLASGEVLAGNPKGVGVIVADLDTPFFAQIAKGVEERVREIGGPQVSVKVASSGYDSRRQIEQIEALVEAGSDLIILNAVDAQAMRAAVAKTQAKGVQVVSVGPAVIGADAAVISDDSVVGGSACAFIARKLGGKGLVALVEGPSIASLQDRIAGCRLALREFPAITLIQAGNDVPGTMDGGISAMTRLLVANPKIDAVFAANDSLGIGSDLASEHAGRQEFFIVSVDGTPEAEAALRSATGRLAASFTKDPLRMGRIAVDLGYGLMQGERPRGDMVQMPVGLVARESIGNR